MLLFFVLALMSSPARSNEHFSLPEPPPGVAPEPIRTFLEQIYKTPRGRAGFEAGQPLLLTPLVEANRIQEAREAAYCPSDQFMPDMDSYAGYLTVNKEYNSHLWFWYFPVSDKQAVVEETPWIIWLQGGPGASSLYGLFSEIGPFAITDDGNLEEIKHSWGKNHSLLFIDNPVGTGFSFTEDSRGYATNQTTIGVNLYAALQQFLTIFPELRKAPLTIAGESYAGKHIPSLAIQIHWHKGQDQPINLHGLAIGNGFMNPESLQRYSYFVREAGLVDDRVADRMRQLEAEVVQFVQRGNMLKAFAYYNDLLSVFLRESRLKSLYNYINDEAGVDGPYLEFVNRDSVRRALHVGRTEFTSIGEVYKKLVPDFMNSARPWLEVLLDNYPVMCYNGHLDIIVAYHPSVNTYNSFKFSGSEDYKNAKRFVWRHDDQVVGYYKVAGNFTEVMVRSAGHMVPTDQPAAALGLISAFARGIPLDRDTGFLVGEEKNAPRRRKLPSE